MTIHVTWMWLWAALGLIYLTGLRTALSLRHVWAFSRADWVFSFLWPLWLLGWFIVAFFAG